MGLTWNGDRVMQQLRAELSVRVGAACNMLRDKTKEMVSQSSGNTHTPSRPGNPPHTLTGAYRESIVADHAEGSLTGLVGSNSFLAPIFEVFGRQGGKVITPKGIGYPLRAKAEYGGKVYGYRVVQGAIAPRHHIRRAMYENATPIRRIIGGGK